MRAARVLWAKLVKQFNPKNPKSMALRTHSQTSGWSLTAQDPFNNVVRTCVEAMAAALGPHAIAAHQCARRGDRAADGFLRPHRAQHADLSPGGDRDHASDRSVGGSFFVEALTHELMQRAWGLIQEVEALGGMAKAIETGLPKLRIEEAAARRQAHIDSGKDVIVGVNAFRLDKEPPTRRARSG